MANRNNEGRKNQQGSHSVRTQVKPRSTKCVKGNQKPYEPFPSHLLQNDLAKDLGRLYSYDRGKDTSIQTSAGQYGIDKFVLKARCPFLYDKLGENGIVQFEEDSVLVKEDSILHLIRDMYAAVSLHKEEIDNEAKNLFEIEGEQGNTSVEERLHYNAVENHGEQQGNAGCCPLGDDLLEELDDEETADLLIKVDNKEIRAHRQLLTVRCPYFEAMLRGEWSESENKAIDIKNVSYGGFIFVLKFIYGGVRIVPDNVQESEILQIADMYEMELLKTVIAWHMKQKYCHAFHKPCADCIPGVLNVTPLVFTFGPMEMYKECIRWIRQYYTKVFVNKAVLRLPADIQEESINAIVDSLTPSNVTQHLKECELMEGKLPKVKSMEKVQLLIKRLERSFFEYLVTNLDLVVETATFLDILKGVGWSETFLENILDEIISSLSVENCCRTFTCLRRITNSIDVVEKSALKEGREIPFTTEAKEHIQAAEKRCLSFMGGNIRLLQMSSSWKEMDNETKQNIKEKSGFFDLTDNPGKTSLRRGKQSVPKR